MNKNILVLLVRVHGKKPIIESIFYIFNYCNGLHTFRSAPTALVGVDILIVAVSR